MPRAKANKSYRTFVKGIITEAGPLTYPENASIDEANCILHRDGSRSRRQGMDYEENYALADGDILTNFSAGAVTSHKWEAAGGSGLYSLYVVQAGPTLHFYDAGQDGISPNKKSFTVDLEAHKVAGEYKIYPIEVASGKGRLFVVSSGLNPFYITYDPVADDITTQAITMEIRDFAGVEDGFDVDYNPPVAEILDNNHRYNLYNQGWNADLIFTYTADYTRPYPSNAEIWIHGRDASGVFYYEEMIKLAFGNAEAPKGHYIVGAFDKGRSTVSGLSGLATEVEYYRPSTAAFYAGRVFYSGIASSVTEGAEKNNSNIYFSQILSKIEQAGRCYQVADPTSEFDSDLLPNDGGIISIPEAAQIIKIEPLGNALVVFASNGVWYISGDAEAGFRADSFQVVKVNSMGAIGGASVVVSEDIAMYFSEAGIYLLQVDSVTGGVTSSNITENTIQTLYTDISTIALKYATGIYDPIARKLFWLYNSDTAYTGETYYNKYDKEIIFDLTLQAFNINTISSLVADSPYAAGYVRTNSLNTTDGIFPIVVNGVGVQANTVDVQVTLPTYVKGTSSLKYLTIVPTTSDADITFSHYKNTTFTDWVRADSTGVDYTSFVDTGHELAGDDSRDKQGIYCTTHFKRTENSYIINGEGAYEYDNPSSCLWQYRWGWADSANSGRWSDQFQAYRLRRSFIPSSTALDYGFEVITTKNKMRGKGKAVSFHIESEAGKDFHLLGWSVPYTGNSDV